jgi:hypothetical protein
MNRLFHQCTFCGERFVTEGKIFGNEHGCEDMVSEVERYRAAREVEIRQSIKRNGTVEPENEGLVIFAACQRAMQDAIKFYAPANPLKFNRRAKRTKCGPKCWGAKREDCACECEGHNHGIQRPPTAVA